MARKSEDEDSVWMSSEGTEVIEVTGGVEDTTVRPLRESLRQLKSGLLLPSLRHRRRSRSDRRPDCPWQRDAAAIRIERVRSRRFHPASCKESSP
jgi:hypothetical protein